MEVEAVDEGTLGKILVAEGTEDVPVNQPIAVLLGEGEDAAAIANAPAAPKAAAPKPSETAPAAAKAQEPAPAPVSKGEGGQAPGAIQQAGIHDGASGGSNGHGRVFASPLARRLAREAGIDVSALAGSGPHGRVVKRDIEQAKAGGAPLRAPAAAPAGAPAVAPTLTDDKIRALYAEGSYDVVPHDSMRRTIARRLVEAKATIPHYYLTADVDLDALMAARLEINNAAPKDGDKPAWKASVNDFIIKALALALIKVPEANVTWTEGGMLRHHHADVGVAVALPGGLITPVVRQAEVKSISAIAKEMKDLAARARARKLKPEEYQGGSSAVSNLGMYGIKEFSAVINPPHASILAVGTGEKRAVVRGGQVVAATQMTATLSADHRAIDGALGAELLSAFRGFIERPMTMLA
jgi:pyruvate dehydrogenase E2 component (dihydrolipoamide acetyltransferase)